MTRLYELTGQYAELQQLAEAGEDVSSALAQLSGEIEQKGAAIVRLMRDMSLDVDKIDEELSRLTARKKAISNNHARLKEYLRANMEACNMRLIKAATFSISLSEGSESVEITDESLVPADFKRTREEIDKAKVLRAYRDEGLCVAGTNVVRGTKLTIR